MKETVPGLSQVLANGGIELCLSSAKAPHRQGLAESLHKILSRTLKRSGLTSKHYLVTQWTFICSYLTYVVNSRPLNLRYAGDSLCVLTPNKLLYGERGNFYSDERLHAVNIDQSKLYERMNNLEKELSAWRRLWDLTYLKETLKIHKWKQTGESLQVGSVVLITDHLNKETGYPALATVTECLSERTYRLRYVKKECKLNSRQQVIEPALVGELLRPAQSLCLILNPGPDGVGHGAEADPTPGGAAADPEPAGTTVQPEPGGGPAAGVAEDPVSVNIDTLELMDSSNKQMSINNNIKPKVKVKVTVTKDKAEHLIKNL